MLLCFISTTFWQCQKEDDLQGTHFGKNLKTTQTKYLEGEEALKIQNLLNSELEKSNQRIYSKNSSSMRTDYGTIDFSTIMEVIDTIGIRNYTFRIKNHPEEDHNTFFNLVVNVYNDQSIVFLMRYDMSDNYASLLEQGITTPGGFEGIAIPGGFEGVITPILITTEHPCPQIEQPIVVNPTTPNPGTGGGGQVGGPDPGNPSTGNPGGGGEFEAPCEVIILVPCCSGQHYGSNCKCAEGFQGATYYVSCRPEAPQTNTEPCPDLGDVGILLPEEIILDPSFCLLYPCQCQLVSETYSSFSGLNNLFMSTFIGNSNHNVIYKNSNTISTNGSTVPLTPIIAGNQTIYNFEISLRNSYLETATDLSIARTIIHENVHAILLHLRYTNFIQTPSPNTTYEQLLDAYIDKLITLGNVPFMPITNNNHHDLMAEYVSFIAESLKSYGISKGYNLSDDFYDAMSWGGLTSTATFQALYPQYDSNGNINPDWQRIINTIVAEQDNLVYLDANNNNITPQGTPCQ